MDGLVADHCDGMSERQANTMLGVDNGLHYFSAAIRELFEESGVLLATLTDSSVELAAARDALNRGMLDWARFLADHRIRLDCAALHYFSFWVTPEALPQRYSTRFFLAAMPAEQEAGHCGGEVTDSCWVTAQQALHAQRDGSMLIHFPTARTLEEIARHQSVEALLAWAAARAASGVPCIFPTIGRRGGERRVIVGGRDAGTLE